MPTTTTPTTTTPTTTTTEGIPATTCRPREDIPEFDPNNPEVIVTPGEDGDCEIPPIELPITPGQKKNISITFKLERHPLDVYYLMDFSGSMSDDKNNLVRLSSALVTSLENMTSDFHLAFGAHVDKPKNPLGAVTDYSVRNRMPLTADYKDFTRIIQATPILSGGDGPESAGDALAQVALCEGRIGWRSNTRRLVILATDAKFHVAGDGRAAGITTPFDKRCRLDAAGNDPEELNFDYASIDQVADIVNENGVTVIYAVTSNVASWYRTVASKVRSSAVGVLSGDSSNIIGLVEDVYHKLEKRVELEKGAGTSDEIKIRYFTSCGKYSSPEETAVCEELGGGGGEVTFITEVDLALCPDDPAEWNQKLRLEIVGLPLAVEIELHLVCE